MKKVLLVALLAVSFTANAACPPYAPYGCQATPSGKMLCGCGR